MKIITCKQYNQEDMQKWHERVEIWKKENNNNIIPQIAFVGFRNKYTGEMKNYGYVRQTDNGARWFRSKQEALNCK